MHRAYRWTIGLGALALCAVVAGCDYIVIPEQQSTAPPAEAEGIWTGVATNVEETPDGLQVDLAIRNDTGDWSTTMPVAPAIAAAQPWSGPVG
jgi:hypothetical protein